jgi:hypothetical protein
VQFVDSADMQVAGAATSDSLGQYQVGPLRPGPYLAGFLHAAIERRGLDQVTVRVRLPAGATVRLNLAAPPQTATPRPPGAPVGGASPGPEAPRRERR